MSKVNNTKEVIPGADPRDKDPLCGVSPFTTSKDDMFIQACATHDARSVMGEEGKEADDQLDRALHLLAENYPYPEHNSGFARWWNTRRADLFTFLARSYSRWFR